MTDTPAPPGEVPPGFVGIFYGEGDPAAPELGWYATLKSVRMKGRGRSRIVLGPYKDALTAAVVHDLANLMVDGTEPRNLPTTSYEHSGRRRCEPVWDDIRATLAPLARTPLSCARITGARYPFRDLLQ